MVCLTSYVCLSVCAQLYIYSGTTRTPANLLGTFSGASLPTLTSMQASSLLLVFVTNGNTTSTGWTVSYVARYRIAVTRFLVCLT